MSLSCHPTPTGAAYRRAVARQLALRGPKGLEAAVGGHFDPVGARERDIADRAGLQPNQYLVDVGCGSGRLAAALKDRPHLRYLGLDVAPALLERAGALCERPGGSSACTDRSYPRPTPPPTW